MSNNKTDITINELTTEVKGLTSEMRSGFSNLENKMTIKFAGLDKKIDDHKVYMDEGFDMTNKHIDNLENLIVKDHDTRICRIERKLQLA